jgi:hypothetical protein
LFDYALRILRGNIRLILMALVAAAGFLVTEVLRDDIKQTIIKNETLANDIDVASASIGDVELALLTGRSLILKFTIAEMDNFRSQLAGLDLPKADPNYLFRAVNQLDEVFGVLNNHLATQSDRLHGIGTGLVEAVQRSGIPLGPMSTGLAITPPNHQNLRSCMLLGWPDVPPPMAALVDSYETERKAAPKVADIRTAFVDRVIATEAMQSALVAFGQFMLDRQKERNALIFNPATPELRQKELNRDAAVFMLQRMAIATRCLETQMQVDAGGLIISGRLIQNNLASALPALRHREENLRYLSYLVALVAFFASNLKPAAAPAARVRASIEPDSFASGRGEKVAVPHDAPPAHKGADGPAGDGHPIIGGPSGT